MRPGPIARTAAALGATVVAAAGLLTAQAFEARRRIGRRTTAAPYADGRYGNGPGTSIRLAILGDSGAAGLGAGHPEDTIGAILATGLAQVSGRTVTLSNHAVIGAQTSDLDGQVDRALWTKPHVAVIMIGANAITLYFLNNLMSFERFAVRFVGGDVGALLDLFITPGTGRFVAHVLGLAFAITLAGFLYRRKIFLRV